MNEDRIAFGINEERAGVITTAVICTIAYNVVRGLKVSPVELTSDLAAKYSGEERDFVIYSCGKIYGEWITHTDILEGKLKAGRSMPHIFMSYLSEEPKDMTLEQFIEKITRVWEKRDHQRRGENILSQVKFNSNEEGRNPGKS